MLCSGYQSALTMCYESAILCWSFLYIKKYMSQSPCISISFQIYFLPRILPKTSDTIAITRIAPINAGKI